MKVITQGLAEAIDAVEEKFFALDIATRSQATRQLVSKAAHIVRDEARITVPQPGYPGDKTKRRPDLKPLRDTIGVRTRDYTPSETRPGSINAYIGPMWPKGAHGHNVEFGHLIRVNAKRRQRIKGRFIINSRGERKRTQGRSIFYPGQEGVVSKRFGVGGRTKPVLFMTRAAQNTQFQVRSTLRTGLKDIVERAAKRQARRTPAMAA